MELEKIKVWIILAVWLNCTFVVAASVTNYRKITFTTNGATVGTYQSFVQRLRNCLQSTFKSHGIALLRPPSEITNANKFVLVELINKTISIIVAICMVDVYVIGFKSKDKFFFLKDAPLGSEALLCDGPSYTHRTSVCTRYTNLGIREHVRLGIGPLGKAIEAPSKFDGKTVDRTFKNSLLVVIQMVSEAARFKFIELKILRNIAGHYMSEEDTLCYENNWDKLSKQIQLCGVDGEFNTPIRLTAEKVISNVAQVKSDITILKYHAPRI